MPADFYWNKDNFEGLTAIAEELGSEPSYQQLRAYCELREKGLRRQALTALDEFLSEAESWDTPRRRGAALRVVEIHFSFPQAHHFLSHPLQERLVEPSLRSWITSEPDAREPLRALALLHRDAELLSRSLALNPGDEAVRAALIDHHLGSVDYATHHLVEDQFIGDEDEARQSLEVARRLLEVDSDSERLSVLRNEYESLSRLLSDWTEYKRGPQTGFVEWCQRMGRSYDWPTIIYYDDGDAR